MLWDARSNSFFPRWWNIINLLLELYIRQIFSYWGWVTNRNIWASTDLNISLALNTVTLDLQAWLIWIVPLPSALFKRKTMWMADFIVVWYRKKLHMGIILMLLETFLTWYCPEQSICRRFCKPPDMNKSWQFFLGILSPSTSWAL